MSETPRRATTLVLAAWEPEMAPLRRFLRSPAGIGTVAVAAGIGAVDAAVGAARAIAAHRPARVIFVGTAGLYPGTRLEIGLGDAAVAGELVLASTAVVRGDGYLPGPQIREAATAPDLRAALLAASAGGSAGAGGLPDRHHLVRNAGASDCPIVPGSAGKPGSVRRGARRRRRRCRFRRRARHRELGWARRAQRVARQPPRRFARGLPSRGGCSAVRRG